VSFTSLFSALYSARPAIFEWGEVFQQRIAIAINLAFARHSFQGVGPGL